MSRIEKRRQILVDYVKQNGSITTSQANDMLKQFYYCNHEHYVAEILSRLVKSGIFHRKERGIYILRNTPIEHSDKNQISLF